MQIDSNFTFTTWLSKKAYSKKPTGKEYSSMAWDEKQISVLDFTQSISHGHSFTQVYYGSRKLKKNFNPIFTAKKKFKKNRGRFRVSKNAMG